VTGPRTVATIALAAVALLGAACGEGSDGPAERSPDAAAAGRDTPRPEAPTPSEGEAPAGLAVAEFAVEGMTCGGCALATEMAVRKLDGVASADADYDESTGEGSCTVTFDPSVVTQDRIARAIRGAGFEPRRRQSGTP
jgi:copper chaperone CopZ